eukprot:Skav230872  [mRNA]  locus=scaffold1335:449290:450000:- [translate_table: standard]
MPVSTWTPSPSKKSAAAGLDVTPAKTTRPKKKTEFDEATSSKQLKVSSAAATHGSPPFNAADADAVDAETGAGSVETGSVKEPLARDWEDDYNLQLLHVTCAGPESDEDVPVNIRAMTRINQLKMEYQDYKDYNGSYGCMAETWDQFRDGAMEHKGWIKKGDGEWAKDGAVPPVTLPAKVVQSWKEGKGILMAKCDALALKESKSKKRTSSAPLGMKSKMRKPAAKSSPSSSSRKK